MNIVKFFQGAYEVAKRGNKGVILNIYQIDEFYKLYFFLLFISQIHTRMSIGFNKKLMICKMSVVNFWIT